LAHNKLGNILRDQGKLDEAIAAYREAIRLKSDSALWVAEAARMYYDVSFRQG
jgi:cytochrome c-type biogenesis protein CcmH/NrfG